MLWAIPFNGCNRQDDAALDPGFVAGQLKAGEQGRIFIGATAQHLPPERRAFASGFINAGGSFGQFVFAPLAQALITAFGWITALLSLAASALLTIPLALPLRDKHTGGPKVHIGGISLSEQTLIAFKVYSRKDIEAAFSLGLD